jgi:hypothetical protein
MYTGGADSRENVLLKDDSLLQPHLGDENLDDDEVERKNVLESVDNNIDLTSNFT